MFEIFFKFFLWDNLCMFWFKWKFDLIGSMVEEFQVLDMSYGDGICLVNVNFEFDIMLSVLYVILGLNEQFLIDIYYFGFVYLCVLIVLKDDNENLLQLLMKRDFKYYFFVLKFKDGIYRMLNELKVILDQKKNLEMEDFDLEIVFYGFVI